MAGRLRVSLGFSQTEQAWIHRDGRLEPSRRVPGSAAAHPADRCESDARQGAPSRTRSVAVGCLHSRGVRRSRRRIFYSEDLPGFDDFEGTLVVNPSSNDHERGPRREPLLQGAVGPPHRLPLRSRLASPRLRRRSRPVATRWVPRCWRRRCDEDGRRFVPPAQAPQPRCRSRNGARATPPWYRKPRPGGVWRGRSRPTCQRLKCGWGACLSECEVRLEITTRSPHNLHERGQDFSGRLCVAPVNNFPGPLGRVKASFAGAHRSTTRRRTVRAVGAPVPRP